MARQIDPTQVAAKWAARMASAGQAYTDGINATTVNPMALANTPEAQQRYQDGVMRSISSGKRSRSLQAADPSFWKQQAVQYGASNLAAGARKSQQKYQKAATTWAPVWMRASDAAAAVQGPKSLSTATAKVNAALQVMMQHAGTA